MGLSNVTMKFAFPEPGLIEGKPTIVDVNLTVFGLHLEERRPCLAYVAQHAFHHLEKHMQETPTLYIIWRFAGNGDKESIEFKSDELSVDEESGRSAKLGIGGGTAACASALTRRVRRRRRPLSTDW